MTYAAFELRLLALTVDPAEAVACLPRRVKVWRTALTEEELHTLAYQYYGLRNGSTGGTKRVNAVRLDTGLSRVCKEYAAKCGPLPEGLPTEDLFMSARGTWKTNAPAQDAVKTRLAELPDGPVYKISSLYKRCFYTATGVLELARLEKDLYPRFSNALRIILGVKHHHPAWRVLIEDLVNLDGVSMHVR